MRELVRVKDPTTGHRFTTDRKFAEKRGLTVLDGKDAVDAFGKPLQAQYSIQNPKAETNKPADTPKEG